ncbi:MAG: NAD(+)/NADH kinase [bacterium]|jgi:NAD+ kinase|nr:NAD(+)/NADH kinase [Planctomycetota bacterium]HIL51686.1 NAD(+)/NADH kinase [Planctomycetota bacterium]
MAVAPRQAPEGSGSAAPSAGREAFCRDIARVLVLADFNKKGVPNLLLELRTWLEGRVQEVEEHHDLREFCSRLVGAPHSLENLPDVIVVLGGDGSMLSVVRAFGLRPVPVLGINFGRIGFLASVRSADWQAALEEVLEGRSVLEPRMRLVAEIKSRHEAAVNAIALNEILVQRGAVQGMLTMSLWDGETWVSDYRADGLIVSSPSGSTAHSLAAGGPILAPSMGGLVVTPISPQSLSHRPLVVHPESMLKVRIEQASGMTMLAVDGHGFYPMHLGDHVLISQAQTPYPILARPGSDPYLRIRERLGWRGSFEPEPEDDTLFKGMSSTDAGEGEVL